ncbi:PREDICTED: SH3 domain-binding glutamic acid-rich-like protein [Phaethon lepturus]|uniref:SH3 domain-binding glutamic acid-rich-like protein n=1 Tax=Phaethon lepturus TaxID=97097 RepID=UPI0005306DDF|nr:PREDICTED: SH3 domain-binding glutamic acid-rich-like protein [Phaethon lepturus]
MAVSSSESLGSALPNRTLPGQRFSYTKTSRPGSSSVPRGRGAVRAGAQAPYLALGRLCPDLSVARRELPLFPSPHAEEEQSISTTSLCQEVNNSYMTIKKQQQDVLGFLEANKIEFEEKDIAANEENRKWMRENVPEDSRPASGNPLPPRLFNDSRYLGDYEAFFEARENNAVYAFLGLTAPPGSKEAEALAKQQA